MDALKVTIYKLKLQFQSPKGSGKGADPQQLLISSAVACYTMTLAYMLDKNKLPVTGFFMDTEGNITHGDLLSIIHRPHVVLNPGATNEDISMTEALMQKQKKIAILVNY